MVENTKSKTNFIFTIFMGLNLLVLCLFSSLILSTNYPYILIIFFAILLIFIILISFRIKKFKKMGFERDITSKEGLGLFLLNSIFFVIELALFLYAMNVSPSDFNYLLAPIFLLAISIIFMSISIYYYFKKRKKYKNNEF
ncbi:MAG: hypothetical protein ACFFDN_35325 [Candidatus Hodarchaeota archaeon]